VPPESERSDGDHAAAPPEAAEEQAVLVDVVADELALARAQLDSGLAMVAEGHLRRHLARLEADGAADDELDATRVLLAESLWRQGRVVAAGAIVETVRSASPHRRRPIAQLVKAEAHAAAGDIEAGEALVEQVVAELGVEGAWRLRAGMPSRLSWPVPAILRPGPERRLATSPFPASPSRADAQGRAAMAQPHAAAAEQIPEERVAAARSRLEAARQAYSRDRVDQGDRELSVAVRLHPGIAADGVALIEPTLGQEPDGDRLLLYGDLLRAAGRSAEANAAYDRAAGA
jgi:hypothetical protein